ncbi:MAG: 23S rRNA (pseudouridine(1915)-N(3))-methyltransferase RlmH [Prolixibacteraceae bacterium]|jgi:23S rRNA (pseudouridine1915-N3)-methyltransferase|nr:23S rRNA (pseudouridine(1915)-N(3))-methyltransferase RlmH [Prolixibacteraceae bacterium]
MKIKLLLIGKTDDDYLKKGIEKYLKRLKHYITVDVHVIPDIKNTRKLTEEQQKQKEGEQILSRVATGDHLILLDEKGKEFNSELFAKHIEKKMITGTRCTVFVVGGPYGFSADVYKRCNEKISLSQMTFSHQMVRLIFTEQIYRAMTIIKGEPYHHQ